MNVFPSITRRLFICFLLAAFLSGCRTAWYHGSATLLSPSGRKLCALHRIPLVTVRGYTAPKGTIIDMTDQYSRVAAHFPNRMSPYDSLGRGTFATIPAKITYCPKCEEELEKRLNR